MDPTGTAFYAIARHLEGGCLDSETQGEAAQVSTVVRKRRAGAEVPADWSL